MKRILALASIYPTAKNPNDFPIIDKQLETYSLKSDITLLHITRTSKQHKYIEMEYEEINPNFKKILVKYRSKTKKGLFFKLRSVMETIRVGRMVCDVIMAQESFDQVQVHYSWPLIILGRELLLKHKMPLFIFAYDINYIYLQYRQNNPISIYSYLANLFALRSVSKVFGPTPALIKKVSRKYQIKDKVSILPFAVDTEMYNFEMEDVKDNQVFISVNSLTKEYFPSLEKEISDLMTKNEDIQIVLCGVSKEYIDSNEIPTQYQNRISWVNPYEDDEKSHALKSCAVAVIVNESNSDPSIFNQAMCSGCYILASPIVSFARDLDDETGKVFSPSEPGEFSDKISAAMMQPQDYYKISTLGKKNFGEEAISNSYFKEIKYY